MPTPLSLTAMTASVGPYETCTCTYLNSQQQADIWHTKTTHPLIVYFSAFPMRLKTIFSWTRSATLACEPCLRARS